MRAIIESIDPITEDNQIKESMRRDFKNDFRELLEKRKIKPSDFKNHILYFIYKVRNNIFHGTKDSIQMSEEGQRKRLKIYTNILIATNEMLFKILEREKIFVPQSSYHINIK